MISSITLAMSTDQLSVSVRLHFIEVQCRVSTCRVRHTSTPLGACWAASLSSTSEYIEDIWGHRKRGGEGRGGMMERELMDRGEGRVVMVGGVPKRRSESGRQVERGRGWRRGQGGMEQGRWEGMLQGLFDSASWEG